MTIKLVLPFHIPSLGGQEWLQNHLAFRLGHIMLFGRLKTITRFVIYHSFLGQSCTLAIRATMSSRHALIYQFLSCNILILGLLGVLFIHLVLMFLACFLCGKGSLSAGMEHVYSIRPCAEASHLCEAGRWVTALITVRYTAFLQPV